VNAMRLIESAGRLEGNSVEITLRGDIAPQIKWGDLVKPQVEPGESFF